MQLGEIDTTLNVSDWTQLSYQTVCKPYIFPKYQFVPSAVASRLAVR